MGNAQEDDDYHEEEEHGRDKKTGYDSIEKNEISGVSGINWVRTKVDKFLYLSP